MSSASYEYRPLPNRDSIRLLLLFPGAFDDPKISCHLLSVSLSEAPSYEAISYVWGDSSDTVEIECGKLRLRIRRNLADALRRLRWQHNETRCLWADAICINQEDISERNAQVQLMGLIYWEAAMVIVWLGPYHLATVKQDDGTLLELGAADAFELISETVQQVFEKEDTYGSFQEIPPVSLADLAQYDIARWTNLSRLLARPWFQRAWVIQEIGLAARAWLTCGNSELSLTQYIPFIRWLVFKGSLVCSRFAISTVSQQYLAGDFYLTSRTDEPLYEDPFEPEDRMTFLDVLSTAMKVQCSDPRDHVYAFLGHPSAFQAHTEDHAPFIDYRSNYTENRRPIMEPDYALPIAEIYKQLATNTIERMKSLRILSFVENHDLENDSALADVVSWVPRWDVTPKHTFGFAKWYSALLGYRASGHLTPEFRISGNVLQVRGLLLDVIDWHSSPLCGFVDGLLEPSSHPRNPLEDCWKQYCAYTSAKFPETTPDFTSFSYVLTAGMGKGDFADNDLDQHETEISAYRIRKAAALGHAPPQTALKDYTDSADADASAFLIKLLVSAESQSMLGTRNGLLGLASPIIRPGDECWVICGVRLPLVLRPVDRPGHYKLIGPAYINDVMRGECVEAAKAEDFQEVMLC